MIDTLNRLAEEIHKTAIEQGWWETEREARDRFTFTEPEQCSLNVDSDTGEVVEESEVADE